mmetsp:Transcript_62692/g.136151  ORF Transcript_62692/g.136151 Transcript_62692/m.136151 type:complete len:270 (-) Transcript_62692:503-1312(-)
MAQRAWSLPSISRRLTMNLSTPGASSSSERKIIVFSWGTICANHVLIAGSRFSHVTNLGTCGCCSSRMQNLRASGCPRNWGTRILRPFFSRSKRWAKVAPRVSPRKAPSQESKPMRLQRRAAKRSAPGSLQSRATAAGRMDLCLEVQSAHFRGSRLSRTTNATKRAVDSCLRNPLRFLGSTLASNFATKPPIPGLPTIFATRAGASGSSQTSARATWRSNRLATPLSTFLEDSRVAKASGALGCLRSKERKRGVRIGMRRSTKIGTRRQ